MLTRLAALAAAAAVAGCSLPSSAGATAPALDPTSSLLAAVADAGVNVHLVCPDDAGFAGMYASSRQLMAVCTGGTTPDQGWTADQRDTLRHEAIHLAQDCWGIRGDNRLETTRPLTEVIRLMAAAAEATGMDFQRIEQIYRERGADDMTILLEFEAWAGAAVLSEEQVEAIVQRACIDRNNTVPVRG